MPGNSRTAWVQKKPSCSICIQNKLLSDIVFIKGCFHSYCSRCVDGYVAAKVEENVAVIARPDPGCEDVTVSSGVVVGVDGQYSTQQLYYPSPIYQTVVSPAYVWDSPPVYAVGLHDNGYGRDPTATHTNPNYLSQNHVIAPSKAAVPSRSSAFGKKGSVTTVDASQSAAMNQALKSATKVNGELSKGFHLANHFHSYPSPGKGSLLYPSIDGNVKTAGRTWVGTDKQKEANQPQGATGFDMLNEQNRGPRTNVSQGPWVSAYDSTAGSDATINNGIIEASIKKEDFNLPDFSTKIKQQRYTEDLPDKDTLIPQ